MKQSLALHHLGNVLSSWATTASLTGSTVNVIWVGVVNSPSVISKDSAEISMEVLRRRNIKTAIAVINNHGHPGDWSLHSGQPAHRRQHLKH